MVWRYLASSISNNCSKGTTRAVATMVAAAAATVYRGSLHTQKIATADGNTPVYIGPTAKGLGASALIPLVGACQGGRPSIQVVAVCS